MVGGTAWLWAPSKATGCVDVLFVDEAGQFSLANALAVSRPRSLVLLGDPQQLDQPLKGTHPRARSAALGHLLGEHDVMPDDRGLFLENLAAPPGRLRVHVGGVLREPARVRART